MHENTKKKMDYNDLKFAVNDGLGVRIVYWNNRIVSNGMSTEQSVFIS